MGRIEESGLTPERLKTIQEFNESLWERAEGPQGEGPDMNQGTDLMEIVDELLEHVEAQKSTIEALERSAKLDAAEVAPLIAAVEAYLHDPGMMLKWFQITARGWLDNRARKENGRG